MISLRSDVSLALLTLEHAPAMFKWMQDQAISRNIGLRQPPSMEKTEAWIRDALNAPDTYPKAINVAGYHVGNVILDRIDSYLGTARLSIYLGEGELRGAGIGRTAIYLTLFEAFRKLNLHKVWLTVHALNYSAINSYVKIGFALEGILRDEFLLEGQRVNALYMGVLRPIFEQLQVKYE